MLKLELGTMPGCCGLDVAYDFGILYTNSSDACLKTNKKAMVAVTGSYQRTAIRQLKKNGFKPVRKFKGNYRRVLTLWFRPRIK